MAHMEKDIEYGRWIEVDGPCGTEAIPADLVGKVKAYHGTLTDTPDALRAYCENRQVWSIETRKGYGARMSAPGYMDCTPWCVFETEQEALDYLAEQYGDDDDATDEPED